MQQPFSLEIKQVHSQHMDALLQYLHALSPQSQQRFAPHPFTEAAIWDFYQWQHQHLGYAGFMGDEMVAYFIMKRSFLEHDKERLEGYGIKLHPLQDFTLAPSVADNWQGKGVAGMMMRHVLTDARKRGAKRLLLWGGVQCGNTAAVKFYQKHGFISLGTFEYNGCNMDMVLDL
jgi:GNAT superfamily N-acetyltransferase